MRERIERLGSFAEILSICCGRGGAGGVGRWWAERQCLGAKGAFVLPRWDGGMASSDMLEECGMIVRAEPFRSVIF